jgi:uncharacterized protein YidB (DUF937 family)
MGLLDVLNGMQNGPRGQRQPSSTGGGGGMSPIMMALLGLLAYKAVKGLGGQSASSGGGGTVTAGNPSGGLGNILGGLFGGTSRGEQPGGSPGQLTPGGLRDLLGGPEAGSVLSNGLNNLIRGFQESGHGQAAQSWVGTGPNQEIAPDDLGHALGNDTLEALSRQTGLGREDLLDALRQQLPELVDKLTPEGRLPTAEEASRTV